MVFLNKALAVVGSGGGGLNRDELRPVGGLVKGGRGQWVVLLETGGGLLAG